MNHHITSRNNPKVKELLKRKDEYFFFEGEKLVMDVLAQGQEIEYMILHEDPDNVWQPPQAAKIRETWRVSGQVLSKLSSLKDTPRLLAVMPLIERPVDFSKSRVVIGVDQLQDPGNAGSIFRCAAAFGVEGVVFTGASVKFNNSKFLRAAQNALFQVRFQQMNTLNDLLTAAGQAGLNIYITSSHTEGNRILPEHIQTPCLILLGSEGQGLESDLFNRFPAVTIPQTGAVESLNVGVSACILMHRLFKE